MSFCSENYVFSIINCFLNRFLEIHIFLPKIQVSVIEHPPYSPDLSLCDYFLFSKMMNDDIEAYKVAMAMVVDAIEKQAMQKFMLVLVDGAQHCIDAEGTYFE